MFPVLHLMVAVVLYNSKMRIDISIVLRIVFMVGRRNKKRVEINGFYSEIFEIVEFFSYAL